jgi:glycine oxidase
MLAARTVPVGHRPHAAIAGAGLAGRLLAWRLLQCGWRVSLFDSRARSNTQSASHVAAAMLSPLAEQAAGDAVVLALAQRSMALWPEWLAALQTQSASTIYARFEGTLVLAHPPDHSHLVHFHKQLQHALPATEQAHVKTLQSADIAQLEPALAGRFDRGLFLTTEGQLANDQLLAALEVTLIESGHLSWHAPCQVNTLQAHALISEQGTCQADAVIDTRGVGATSEWSGLLRGVRGEIITVECPGITLQRPVRLMHPRYQLYIAPRPEARFVVGATELESQDTGPATVRSVLELASALYSLHSAFGEARILHIAAALRPALIHHQPTVRQHHGVWQLNGLYRHGYLCAPALVDALVQQLNS